MRGLLLFAAFLSLEAQLHAQTLSPELRDLIEQRIESTAEELGDNSDVDLSGIVEQLMDRLHDPIDLNHTNAEELSSLDLLSDLQVNAILDHIKRFGKFISIYELQTVDGMDNATLEVLQPFVTIHGADRTRTPLKEMLANGTSEVIVRMVTDVQQRKGFLGQQNIFGTLYTDPDGGTLPNTNDPQVLDSLRQNSKVYLGSPWKVYTRYRFRYRQNIDFGVTGEKDAGEQFFKGTEPQGFDFYSAHLFLRNVGPLKALALGDFQACFGQGLVFSSGLSYARKSAYTMNIKGTADGLT
ncbi:MAG: helix-hairpin-helix domain-containing protein, partial [Flavobacteriales bacterium]